MTESETKHQIEEQINALKKATDIATKSRESANKYLMDAGIISKEKDSSFEQKPHKQ